MVSPFFKLLVFRFKRDSIPYLSYLEALKVSVISSILGVCDIESGEPGYNGRATTWAGLNF
jgi:hypothetical protein